MVLRGNSWGLYIPLFGSMGNWPGTTLPGPEVPTVAARAAALAELGYETTEEWSWDEERTDDTDDDSPVILIAWAEVTPID
ncbi:DUF6303 family protein [Embleya sp. NPDC050154]|uniref:DUF6303 family protein n=1 Tax=Embleya sp. NPDC050154 TaxID=3363988 RepID=UPI0037B79322